MDHQAEVPAGSTAAPSPSPNDAETTMQELLDGEVLLRTPLKRRHTSYATASGSAAQQAPENPKELTRTPSLNKKEVFVVMREQDADLLESIHMSGPNATGMTPLLMSQGASVASIRAIPDFSLHDKGVPASPMKTGGVVKSLSDCGLAFQAHSRPKSLQSDVGAAATPVEQREDRQALSGEVWSGMDRNEGMLNGEELPVENALVENGKEDGVQDEQKRTECLDRRLNEAAQFAEAVGDLPPSAADELRIIEEDHSDGDSDDDDDDDATEIRVERRDSAHHSVSVASESEHASAQLLDVPAVPDGRPAKTRPQWPTQLVGTKRGFLDKLPDHGTSSQDFVYKGIRANPPEIVKRGIQRGNYAQLHRKAWLEVSDKYHRYGKNLRLYYRYWERLGCPTNMFFEWLDSKGEAAGHPLPELDECVRSKLDSDTVLYITNPEVTDGYALNFKPDELGKGHVTDVDGDPVCTGSDGWIFVLRDNIMYGARKVTSLSGKSKQRFHHSSFFGGKAVEAAGIFITDDAGTLTRLYPHSGHYRPGEAHMQRMLFYLYHAGIDLRTFEMDMQQILHVARDVKEISKDKSVEKKKKVESLHLMPAVLVACFLAQKARFIGSGIFAQIHQIRKAEVTSVSEALGVIDVGGSSKR